MDQNHKKAIIEYINKFDPEKDVVKNISPSPDYSGGEIEYNGKNLKLWREISTLVFRAVNSLTDIGYNVSLSINKNRFPLCPNLQRPLT